MTSRLDRLFVLLETGSSSVTRRGAATQLGEVQRLHPHELHSLLARTAKLLKSSAWDTRVAASQAVRAILSSVPPWDPPGTYNNEGGEWLSGRLSFSMFDLQKVASNSAFLMGSEGKEYDAENCSAQLGADQIQNHLLSELGVPVNLKCFNLSMEDLRPNPSQALASQKLSVLDMVSEGLSSREKNRKRRKARQAPNHPEEGDDILAKKQRVEEGGEEVWAGDPTPDSAGNWPLEAVDWPLEPFCDQLCTEVFSSQWEVRHGAATALRELMALHGRGAGRSADMPTDKMEEYHQQYLEDVCLRLLCVLALDRFGDFGSDQVVAPVRETCAQTLGSVVNVLTGDRVLKVAALLLKLLDHPDWDARHGGLLGLKYLLAIRQDMVREVLRLTLPAILSRLKDPVDDVSAVAASALLPAAPTIVADFSDQVAVVVGTVWELLGQDEPAAACHSVMALLAAVLSLPATSHLVSAEEKVVARLWPLLSNNSTSVRKATLQTLVTLTSQQPRVSSWDPPQLALALRHVFQRALIEPANDVQLLVEQVWNNLLRNSSLESLLTVASPLASCWLCLAMQPAKVPFDPAVLVQSSSEAQKVEGEGELKMYVGGSETTPEATREENVMRCRCISSRMLGLLFCYLAKPMPGAVYPPELDSPTDCCVKVLLSYLNSKSAVQRLVTGLVIAEWGRLDLPSPLLPALPTRLYACLAEAVYYDEIALSFTRLLQDTRDFIATLRHYKLPLDADIYAQGKVLTIDQIQQLAGPVTCQLLTTTKLKPKVIEALEERRKAIQTAVTRTASDHQLLNISAQASIVGAVVMLKCLPEKLSQVIKPMMDSIKREPNEILQELSARHLILLMEACIDRSPCPNNKIVNNLCVMLCSDQEFTPKISEPTADSSKTSYSDNLSGIITLANHQKNAERAVLKRSNSSGGRGPGRPPLTDIPLEELFAVDEEAQKSAKVQRRGAVTALTFATSHFSASLESKLPQLWQLLFPDPVDKEEQGAAVELVSRLQVLEVVCSSVHISLLPSVLRVVGQLCDLLSNHYKAVRHLAARCLAALAALDTAAIMTSVVQQVLPQLATPDSVIRRQGAVECLACIADKLQLDMVPYIVLFVVPLLGRMSDQDTAVRLTATHTFAALIQLMPLDSGVTFPPSMPAGLVQQRDHDRKFLEQLFHPRTIPDYKVPVPISATLRSYQQAGVNWLAMLNRYKLHGILCDDMGLGKTLQSICIVAGDHYTKSLRFKEIGSPDCAPLPSIVICPPTLTGHWVYEVDKFLSTEYLNPLHYAGPPGERERLRERVTQHNLVVASYDIVRKDIDFFSSIKWNYCILDEGHVIKNGKTKSSKAIKRLTATHRLILSGTPIQNNVLELWSLFDFLMPGFLGTERQFLARYSRPILASRDPKSSPAEQEAGVLAMEALHKQVLPFVLRRVKEDVLKDLPPKITQDYYCDLSPLQQRLYEDFSRSRNLADISSAPAQTHIFQALRYLQNVCNHPKLVLTPSHPEYSAISTELHTCNTSLSEIEHGCKLPALKQLLLDCGIGQAAADSPVDSVVSPHRALIFCQLKAMLDIVERDLLKKHMPTVTYLRLDGSVPPGSRHSVVARFNSDPSIDVLLLTTQVGGLGLNLTGADTVIFVEHDWSPMRDLQAMDRAHRIGQKKVVNVYRLITRGTLEEKIMGLQKFKLLTANTVISGDNASLETMATDKLLDLFSLESKGSPARAGHGDSHLTLKAVLDTLPPMWDDTCYQQEYDLDNFVKTLRQ